MPTGGKTTLTQFLIETRRRHPHATGDLNGVITDVALACKAISRKVAFGALDNAIGQPHQMFLRSNEWGGHVSGMLSEALEEPYCLPPQHTRGKYLLAFDALDGASHGDVNVPMGSIFSVLRAATPGQDPASADFLQPGSAQVAAGYAIYGPSTMLVLTLGSGTHAFTLEPLLGEWVLSHANLRVPEQTREFAINASNARYWDSPVKRYVDECMAGLAGTRGADFNMRWIASLVAEAHRILMRGGVCLDPRDSRDANRPARTRLLCEANPIAMLIEQAGGMASTGRRRLLEVTPRTLHERVGFVFGSSQEVSRIEAYHGDDSLDGYDSPLFGRRGLFANSAV
jgi:fructose-1,6-bisphosphatase I/sedoheptulose-1,7-bisphosphatase